MSLKFSISTAVAAASLSLVGSLHAQTYAGGSTAGNLPATAEVVPGIAGVTYTAISGTTVPITAGDNIYNAEMYEITLAVPEELTASTTKFYAGANNFDDQLFLLNSSGIGILTNDDASSGGDEASLSTGTTLLAPGNYYLLIAGSGNYPVDSTAALLFPNYTTGVDPTGTYAAQSTLPIAGYTGNSNEGGNYVIALTLTPQAIPEPGSLAFVFAGASGLTLVFRSRRTVNR
jgi:hypothetical protein